MFAGVRLCDWKYDGGPLCEFSWPREEKIFCGLGLEAECEFSWVKVRTAELLSAGARGDILVASCGREQRIKVEAVEAASRVRDAIVSVDVPVVVEGMLVAVELS